MQNLNIATSLHTIDNSKSYGANKRKEIKEIDDNHRVNQLNFSDLSEFHYVSINNPDHIDNIKDYI